MTLHATPKFPKVLHITRNHPPLRGGMERLNAHLFEALRARNGASALLGPHGASRFVAERAISRELADGSLLATLTSSMTRGVGMARRMRPEVVLAGSGLMAPAAIAAAKSTGATPMVYLHGLDIVVRSHVYQAIWLPCIKRCRAVMVNSENTRRLAVDMGVKPDRVRIVHPGTAIPVLDRGARSRFRTRHGIDDATPLLISVGRLTERKGIAEFITEILPKIRSTIPNVQLVIIGDEAKQALHRGDGAGIARVREAVRKSGLDSAVKWLGPCSDEELGDAYQAADLHVFPGREVPGDVEGFGMVAVEAAAHGLPTVAFNVGGVADAISEQSSGWLVAAGDFDMFAMAVKSALGTSQREIRERARQFAAGFTWERFGEEIADTVAKGV